MWTGCCLLELLREEITDLWPTALVWNNIIKLFYIVYFPLYLVMSYYWLHCLDNKYNITSISVSRQVEANGSGFAIYFHWILHKSSCRKQCHLEEWSHKFLSHFMRSFCSILAFEKGLHKSIFLSEFIRWRSLLKCLILPKTFFPN